MFGNLRRVMPVLKPDREDGLENFSERFLKQPTKKELKKVGKAAARSARTSGLKDLDLPDHVADLLLHYRELAAQFESFDDPAVVAFFNKHKDCHSRFARIACGIRGLHEDWLLAEKKQSKKGRGLG